MSCGIFSKMRRANLSSSASFHARFLPNIRVVDESSIRKSRLRFQHRSIGLESGFVIDSTDQKTQFSGTRFTNRTHGIIWVALSSVSIVGTPQRNNQQVDLSVKQDLVGHAVILGLLAGHTQLELVRILGCILLQRSAYRLESRRAKSINAIMHKLRDTASPIPGNNYPICNETSALAFHSPTGLATFNASAFPTTLKRFSCLVGTRGVLIDIFEELFHEQGNMAKCLPILVGDPVLTTCGTAIFLRVRPPLYDLLYAPCPAQGARSLTR